MPGMLFFRLGNVHRRHHWPIFPISASPRRRWALRVGQAWYFSLMMAGVLSEDISTITFWADTAVKTWIHYGSSTCFLIKALALNRSKRGSCNQSGILWQTKREMGNPPWQTTLCRMSIHHHVKPMECKKTSLCPLTRRKHARMTCQHSTGAQPVPLLSRLPQQSGSCHTWRGRSKCNQVVIDDLRLTHSQSRSGQVSGQVISKSVVTGYWREKWSVRTCQH